jgi:hypothetical protein
VDSYGEAYKAQKPIWHGINVAALLRRAQIDGLDLSYYRTSEQVASEVLDTIALRCLGLGDCRRGSHRSWKLG